MNALIRELGNAIRGLKRSPGFTALVVTVLGVGMATTIFMFGAIKSYILTPLPFPEPHRLMHLETNNLARGEESLEVYQQDFLDWREQQQSFTDLAAFYIGTVNLSGASADRPERFDGAFITGNAFEILQARAHIGRTLIERDSAIGAPDVVVLGYATWMHRYNGDASILGETIRVNARDATVVGVMSPEFAFPINQDVWVPLRIDPAQLEGRDSGTTLEVFGRLRDGVTQEQARAEMNAIAARLASEYPETNEGVGAVVQPYAHEYVDRETRATIYTMFATVVLVLVMACANTANLVLVRATRRGRELAIRSALGASRRRLVGRVLAECLMLSLMAAFVGYWLADWAGGAMMTSLRAGDAQIPFWVDFSADLRDVAFTLGVALAATLLAGLLPALRGTRVDVSESLKDGSGGATGARTGRLSRGLVVFEIALSCVLLVCAGLMLRSLVNIDKRDYGADTSNILVARMGLFEEQYPTGESRERFFSDLTARLAGRPGVLSATAAISLPGTSEYFSKYAVGGGGDPVEQFQQTEWMYWTVTTPGVFDMLRIPVLRGRVYDERDRADTEPVVVVTREFAQKAFPGEDALGRQVALGSTEEPERFRTVIGVVDNLHLAEADDSFRGAVFIPMSQHPVRFAFAAVRTAGDPLAFGGELRETVLSLDPDMPVYWLQTLDYWIRYGGWTDRLVAINFQVFGAIALILAAVGMYGVLAYSVAQRTREIGVRRALGANDSRILRSMARQSLWQLGIGLGAGLVLAFVFARFMAGMLVGVEVSDPAVYLGVLGVLAMVTMVSAAVPTWRALRVNPVEALRYE